MSAKTVMPTVLRPEVQEISTLTNALTVWQYGGGSIEVIENQLLRFAHLIDVAIAEDAPPWSAAEAPVMGRAIGVLFELGYRMHPNWAAVYARSLIVACKRTEEVGASDGFDA